MVFTETWLTSEDDAKLYEINNYKHIYNYRKQKKGGGVSIYIHDSIGYEVTENTVENNNHYLWVSIDKLSLNIGGIYRPGDTNLTDFMDTYVAQLEQRKRSIVFGDFNVDLLTNDSKVAQYRNIVQGSGYEIINKIDRTYSTRETSTTNTILDHVCTNINNHSFNFSIIESSLSDHKQIFVEIGEMKTQKNNKIHYKALDYDNLYKSALKESYTNDRNDFSCFEQYVSELIARNRTDKIKILNPPQTDWITKDIINAIDSRNQLHQATKTNPADDSLSKKFYRERNRVRKMIKQSKRKYYYTLFYKNRNNPKKTWEVINSLALNKVKDKCAPPKLRMDSGLVITEGDAICDAFNSFFSTVGPRLAGDIPARYHLHTDNTLMCDPNYTQETVFDEFEPCVSDEICTIIDDLDANTATGLDGISTKAIKCLKNVIAEKLAACINRCLVDGTFPDALKMAKVSPIHKAGSRSDPNNYRPVSVLPVFSKIFERVLYSRLNSYLSEKNILIREQYGFRSKSSTLTATVDLITKIKTNIDKKNIVLGVFIDLKKAFDTVSHAKLLGKLRNIGITGTALKMFSSYLQNRRQVVKFDIYESSAQNVTYGIPQGSIIGPLLFLIYINNISKVGLTGHLTLYADDTCLFYFNKSINDAITEAQRDLDLLNEWLKYNLLTVNTSKTSYMVFSAKNKPIADFPSLSINNMAIHRSNYEKYLGLWIDEKLTWKHHIEHVASKLSSFLGALYKVASYIPNGTRTTIYNSLVKSHLEYLIEIWGSAAKSNLTYLQRMQNKIIKVLYHYHYLTPTVQIYKDTKFLNISQLYKYYTCVLVKNIVTNSIQSNIRINKKVNTHNLRNRYKLELATARTNYGKKTVLSEGVQIFNALPNDLKECESTVLFKYMLKKHINGANQ